MTDRFPVIDPWFVAPRYCQHGMLDDDYCEECERLEAEEADCNGG